MKHKFVKYILAMLFLALGGKGFAQDFSNRGKDFWVAYGHHQFMEPGESPANGQNMVIYLSAEQAAIVTVTVDSSANMFGPDWTRTYSVPANTVISTGTATPIAGFPTPLTPGPIPKGGTYDFRLYSLPCSFVPVGTPCGSEQIFRGKGIHITSDVPIVAYAHIYGSAASGATMLLPVDSWGYTYTSINSNQTNASNSFSWMYVIAKHDSTVVTITPSVTTRLGKPPGVPFDVMLNKGQIYQLIGQTTGNNGLELTGTTVKSIANSVGNCYPVAVFAGSSRTAGNCMGSSSGSRDNDMQQAFPQQSWGKRYLTAPLSQSGSISSYSTSPYKIAVKDPLTVVTRNGVPLTGLTNNYYRFESNQPELIEADKPIMVGQFMASGGSSCLSGSGDPEMMYISPIEQAIKRVGFYRTTLESISLNYVTLIIPTNGLNSLTIESTPWASIPAASKHTYLHPRLTGYSVAIRRWTAANSQVIIQSDSAFNGLTYGIGGPESYGYNAGTFLKNLNAAGSILNTNDTTGATSSAYTCTNTPVKLSVLLAYQTPPSKLEWHLSQVGGGLTPNTDVIDNTPTPVGTQTLNGIVYTKYDLPGTYQFSSIGNWRIPITATHPSIENCTNSEELYYEVEVRGKPVADFAITNTGCVLDTVSFTGQTTSSNGFNVNQWLYTFHDATTSNSKDTAKRYAAAGIYNVNLRIVSAEGCVSDTTKQVALSAAPIVGFTTAPPTACQGAPFTFTDTSSYTGAGSINNSWWDFGDGTFASATNANPINHTYTSYGTFTVRHTAGIGANCVGDTATKIVTVYAPPTTSFTFPSGCLPASGVVQFNSTATTPDGQAITGHAWNFGDPGSGAANTSTLANPSHTYPGFGTYTITYSVTTANGCTKDTVVTATMNLAPTFNYPALAPVCQNTIGTVNVATASVTNGVPGTGEYHGPATTLAGQFTPSAAGAGNFTIWYVYTTTANCRDSVSQNILVNPTPDASFSIPAAGCLPASGTVNFTYTGTALAGQTYLWNFGDPGSGAANTSTVQNPSHNYTTGSYTIKLTVTSAAGCTKDSIVTQAFNVTPALAFSALAAVCQNAAGPISVANGSVTNGATGSGIYNGPGTNAGGQFNPAVAGAGTHTIWYVFTATGNCKDSISQTILVYPAPSAAFSIPAAGCLPASGTVNFTYTGTALPGQTYLWNFGDPASGAANTSTIQNPSHNYPTGSFTITLSVTTPNGCVKDSVVTQTFNVMPALAFSALAPVCQNAAGPISVANGSVTNGATGTGVYSGPGTNAAGQFNPAVAGAGTHTIWYVFTATGNCVDSISRTIQVYPAPSAAFSIPAAGCLPASGTVNFTYTGTALPGQTYLWNFGDPASGAANTSTAQNPSHNYPTGSFTITLSVSTPNGCVKDSVVTQVFNVTPALAWPALAPVCESVTGTISIATASVTNGATGSGVYSGPGTTPAGQFSPSAAGAGTHTIWYVFTATGNCKDSISRTILVYAKPNASFTYPTAACLPVSGLAQFTYNGSLSAGQTYLWNFGDPASGASNTSTVQNPTHNYTNTGTYLVSVTVTNANGCTDDSVITTTFSVTPALAWPALAAVCQNASGTINVGTATVTNGVLGTGVYSGPGTNASGQFNPAAAGPGTHTLTYTFTSTGNCTASITQSITVNPAPDASFSIPASGCLPASGTVNFTYTGTALPGQTYSWNFGDPASGAANTSTAQNPSHNYTTGSYTITLGVSTPNGCINDSVVTQSFNVTPALAWPALSPVCESVTGTVSIATATVTNSATGTGVYSGPGTNAAGQFNPSAAGAGTHTIWYVFTATGNCIDSISQTILVYAKPNASFTYPTAACLPTSGLAQFTYNGTVTPGQTYLWNFGDPASGAANTSTVQNPSHNYTNTGTYVVSVTVTNANGCADDSVVTTTFSVTPALAYPALATVCESVVGTVSVATANVTNGVAGTGIYSGPGLDASGNFSPSAAGPGTHTITYTFTSTGNCSATITQTITVNPKPVSSFTITNSICLGQQATITDNSTVSAGTIASWQWFFGDGNTVTYTNGNPFNYLYATAGTYQVKLVTTGSNGCVGDTARQTIIVNAIPVAAFTMPASVCMPNGTVSFTNTSTVAGGSSLTYIWNFGDGTPTSTAVNASHVYAAISAYPVTLTATSAAGCTKDTTQTFSAFFDKPVAAFTVTPDTLCQGTDNVFTDGSTAPNSSIKSRQWFFGDGSSSTATNPTKRYSNPGVYTVKLVVTNNENCISDTFSRNVTVYVQPVVDAGQSFVVPQGTVLQFKPVVNDSTSVSFMWSPAFGLSSPTALRPVLTAMNDQTYTLTATGAGNCTATDFLTVKILRQVVVPNAFSPNGDGINDTWIIDNLADYAGAVVEVFNRYGQQVYSSTGYTNPWDGTVKGKPLPVATYYYIIQLKNGFKPLNGSVTIIR